MSALIKKAVFPVAGLGTRFLPATKANPKEMLAVVDKPLIQYAVEECMAAGIEQFIFITSGSKRAIEDHFDSNIELELKLEQRGQFDLLRDIRNIIPEDKQCIYVRQHNPLGLGHAILCAKTIIGDDPFIVSLADDLIDGSHTSCVQQLQNQFDGSQAAIVAVQPVPMDQTHKYGIAIVNSDSNLRLQPIHGIVEKPASKDAPSNLAAIGRYILTPEIFKFLEHSQPGAGGEIQLTDAIDKLAQEKSVFTWTFDGKRYDCGSKLGYLEAIVDYGMRHPEVGEGFSEFLEKRFEKADHALNLT